MRPVSVLPQRAGSVDTGSVVVGVQCSVAVSVATSSELTASDCRDDDSLMGCPARQVKPALFLAAGSGCCPLDCLLAHRAVVSPVLKIQK